MRTKKNINILMEKQQEEKLKNFFASWMKGYADIDCFAILVILPNDAMTHLSIHSHLTKVYHERKYGFHDQPVNKFLYKKLPFYLWKQPNPTKIQTEIHDVREKIFNLNSGTNFVRSLETDEGNFYVIYCVSSHKKDPLYQYKYAINVNKILEVGDFCYNTFIPILQESALQFTLPKIEKFKSVSCDNIVPIFDTYSLYKGLAERLISFIKKHAVTDEESHTIKESLKLIALNHSPNTSPKLFRPLLVK